MKQFSDEQLLALSRSGDKEAFGKLLRRYEKELFNFLVEILDFDKNTLTFKKNNDIIDSRAQLMCYSDTILKAFKFREEKEYGFIYNGGIDE